MESLYDQHRRYGRNIEAVILILCILLFAYLAIDLWVTRPDEPEVYEDRVDYTHCISIISPDGTMVLESYSDKHFDQSVFFQDFVPTGIRICDQNGETLWEMTGSVVNSLFWSPDSRYAAISYRTHLGEQYFGKTVVVDTTDYSVQEPPLPAEAVGDEVYFYAATWDETGLHLCWDYGNCKAQGSTVWNP